MPRSQLIDPTAVRKGGTISFHDIPVNSYRTPFADEVKHRGGAALIRICRDMMIIREFETMLHLVKTNREYSGIRYEHAGPAHLSVGQEAAAVGQAFVLTVEDLIFGSHRSHGEILAKGLSAIGQLEERHLLEIMESYHDGIILRVIERGSRRSVRELAIDFLLYGTCAEIFARSTGFNKGLGGSMHAFFPPFGIYPNNAVVGGSADIAVGAALFKKCNRKRGIVVCNIGDAAMGCGPVWEAMCLATMDQFRLLWEEEYRGGLPIIFNFMNNHYGMGGQTSGETMGFGILVRTGAGLNPEQMHAERIDGYNPLAVIDAFERKKKILEQKEGPVLLDTVTYRISGHSPSDASSYREKREIELWKQQDSIESFAKLLLKHRVCSESDLENLRASARSLVVTAYKLAVSDAVSPRMDLHTDPDAIGRFMFSRRSVEKLDGRTPETLMPYSENPRIRQIAARSRSGIGADGRELPKGDVVQLRDAIFEAILHAFHTDATLIAFGEENRDWGGAFAVYRGLTEVLPYHRLFNTPISEGAIVGSAVGYGICGGRAIAELMYCDFLGRAGDEVLNQLAKWQGMSAGTLMMPVVLRISVGSKYGAQHSQDWSGLCAHIPGLTVVFPATPFDAKGLMHAALRGTDPVVYFESQRLYEIGELFHPGGVPQEMYEVPIGKPDIKRSGKDITIITVGPTLYTAVRASETLKAQYGLEAELIDLRTLTPLDYTMILESVQKTGKVLLAGDACQRGSFLNDVAQNITALAFDDLDAPPVVMGARNWITPASELEQYFFPQPDWLIDAIHERLLPLPGHPPSTDWTDEEAMRRAQLGI